MISIIELKKYLANIGIFGIIISILYYKKKPYIVILLEIDKDSKIGFYYMIVLFNLIVGLYIKSVRKSPIDAKEIT